MGLTKNQWACRQEKMLVRKTPREQRIIVIEVVFAPPLILFYLNPAIKKINLKDNFLQSKKKNKKNKCSEYFLLYFAGEFMATFSL